jgi:uncharacterized protein YukE
MTQSYDESVATTSHGDLQSVISGLESSLADLGGFVNAVKSSWQGDEMDQYNQIQATWNRSSDTVKSILEVVHASLGKKTGSVRQMRGAVMGALSAPA